MSAMISIDFGNSYTKVGVRTSRKTTSEPVNDASLTQDQLNLCIPSLVGCVTSDGTWYYGMDVIQYGKRTGMQVYRNWKPIFFEGVEKYLSRQPTVPVGASVRVSETRMPVTQAKAHAAKLGVSLGAFISFLRSQGKEVELESATARKDFWERPTEQDFHKHFAVGYFRWLREFIAPICRMKFNNLDVEHTPVRISLPSFGSQTHAEERLIEILQESGWKTDEKHPALAEPVSNAIGIFTEGRNATWFPPKEHGQEFPWYPDLFGDDSEVFRALRNAATGHGGTSPYWTMVIDVGGYTADFAIIGFDPKNFDGDLQGIVDGKKRLLTFSQPIGVHTLDTRVCDVLPQSKADYLRQIDQDIDQFVIERFHRVVYDNLRPHETVKHGTIGAGEEGKNIRDCIEGFAAEIADYAERFLVEHDGHDRIDGLILTGGGCNIPLVRKTVCERLAKYGTAERYAGTYVPADSHEQIPAGYRRVKPLLVRAATAIGGASVFFDFVDSI